MRYGIKAPKMWEYRINDTVTYVVSGIRISNGARITRRFTDLKTAQYQMEVWK